MSNEFDVPNGLLDGITLFKQGRYKDAIPLLKEKLAASPEDIEARVCLAISYSKTGGIIDAISEFTRLTEMQPDEVQHLFNLGMAYRMANDPCKAKETFERVLTKDPNHGKAKEQLDAISSGFQSPTPPCQPVNPQPYSQFNDSPPPEGLNWGAFLLPFFWSIAHSAWVWVAMSFFFHLIASIVLLIKGNEIAYQSRKFASEIEFRAVQKAWTMWGLILLGVQIVFQVCVIFMLYMLVAVAIFGAAFSIPYIIENNPEFRSITGAFSMQPGTGTITTVKPYPGSQKINVQQGKDSDGSFTMTQYSTSADVTTVKNSFEGQFRNGGAFTSNSFSAKANLKATTAFGLAKVDIFRKDGKTHYYIKIYKIKAGQMPLPFPGGFPKDFQKNLPKDSPKGFPPMPVPPAPPHHIGPGNVM